MTDKQVKRRFYYLKYKEKDALRVKMYYEANKDKIAAQRKGYYDSKKDDFYTLYYLKEEHYIGTTNQPNLRLNTHKRDGNHTLDYEAVSTFDTKREALDAEAYMHSIGYNGRNKAYDRGNNLKQ